SFDGGLRPAGDNDLAAVGRRADPSSGMDRQPDVPRLGHRGAAAVDADAHPAPQIVWPRSLAQRALEADGRLDRRDNAFEDSEEFVGMGIDRAATGSKHGPTDDASHVVQ